MFDIEGGIPCYEHIACEEACEHWESNPACYEERLQRLVYLAREAAEGYAEAAECLCAIERAGYACAHGSQVYADDAAEIIEELEKLGGGVRMSKCCPKCGSTLAYIVTQWAVMEAELYDLATGKFIGETTVEDSKVAVKTYRVAECEKCGTRFRLSDEQYEQYRW